MTILLVSHGGLAKAMLDSAEMILGPQADVKALGIQPGESPDALREQLEAALAGLDAQSTLVFTDLLNGTPFNVVASLMQHYPFRHITGVSLGLLLEALSSRDEMEVAELALELMLLYPEMAMDVNRFLGNQ